MLYVCAIQLFSAGGEEYACIAEMHVKTRCDLRMRVNSYFEGKIQWDLSWVLGVELSPLHITRITKALVGLASGLRKHARI